MARKGKRDNEESATKRPVKFLSLTFLELSTKQLVTYAPGALSRFLQKTTCSAASLVSFSFGKTSPDLLLNAVLFHDAQLPASHNPRH